MKKDTNVLQRILVNISDLYRIKHEFYPCHPDLARDLEFELQKEYKDEHGDLPLLNRVENFTGGAKKIK